jgi:ATP-binding cassette subfamily B protein
MIRRLLLLDGHGGLVAAAPAVAPRRIVSRFWPDLRPYRRWIPLVLAAIAVGAATVTVEIWLFKLIVDEVLVPGDLGPLPLIAGGYLGLLALGSLAAFADDYLSTLLAERFTLDLRTRTFAHLQRLSPDFLQRRRLGDLLSRLTGDIRAIESFMVGGLADGLAAVLRIGFFVTALFVLEWRLALAAIVAAPFLWVATRLFGGWIRDASRERRRRTGSLTAVAEEALSNAQLVTASNRQDSELARLRSEGEGALRARLSSARIGGLLSPAIDLAELAGMMAIVVLGSIAVTEGSLTLGGLLVFITYLGKLYGPVRELGSIGETIFEAAAGAERVIELLDREPEVTDRPDARSLGRARGLVELRDVSFTYPGRPRPALAGVDLRLEPGESLALTGPSGAGKSTLARLLLRFHDPDRGRIELDGHDLRDLTLRSLRENVSILLQEAPMMRGSVAENIAYATPEASREQIVAAAEAAGAAKFVEALPEGYETDLGERGRALSGGQRQRIAIARALLADAPVLILDEPTTGLDPAARDALLEPLRRLTAERTTVIVSHDPVLAALADREVEIGDGRIRGPRTSGDAESEREKAGAGVG